MLRTLEERDIRFIRLWFTDVLGFLKSVAVAPAELEGAFGEGIGFDGSAIEGFARVYEADMIAKPGHLPGAALALGVARRRPDVLRHPHAGRDAELRRPRYVLKQRAVAGRRPRVHLLHPSRDRVLPAQRQAGGRPQARARRRGGYFDHTPHSAAHDFRRNAIMMLEAMGISVEYSHHEGAPGQQEIDLRYADALTTADNIMTFRLVMKEVALEQGVHASFMPKPFTEHPGSGMHTHMSLFEGDRNAFYEPGAEFKLSKVGRAFIAGLLRHSAEITAVCNQWVNSYQRLWGNVGSAMAPGRGPVLHLLGPQQPVGARPRPDVQAAQGPLDPHRVPVAGHGREPLPGVRGDPRRRAEGHRGGLRAAAGRRGRRLGADPAERRALGIEPLPQDLDDAIHAMERSELMADVLGEHVFDFFLRNKRQEWEDYRRQVTEFERSASWQCSNRPPAPTHRHSMDELRSAADSDYG